MDIKTANRHIIEISDDEKDILIRGVSQRIEGWADKKIDDYKCLMENYEGLQAYRSGYETYTIFYNEFKSEFKVWEDLVGHYTIHSNRGAEDFIKAKGRWIKAFMKIEQDYIARRGRKTMDKTI